MIYITGDCHGDYIRFSEENFPEQKELSIADYVIVCGDFGLWHDTKDERKTFDWLEEKNFTILFVDGNHENFDRLYSNEFEIVNFHGGKAHRIRNNIYHLMRGFVFNLCDKKFFTFGGARSHDIKDGILEPDDYPDKKSLLKDFEEKTKDGKVLRVNHLSWWEQELPDEVEMERGLKILAENDFKVDFILTHCCPQRVASVFSHGFYKPDKLTKYFNTIADKTTFDVWFFGHYHDNQRILGKYIMLYEQIMRCV